MRSFEHIELVSEGEDFELQDCLQRARSRSVISSKSKRPSLGRLLIAGCNSNGFNKNHVSGRECVQIRQTCSVGVSPTGGKVRTL